MGQATNETVRQIEDTRDRLEDEIRELEDRLPRPAIWAKRMAVGGGVAGAATLFLLRRRKKKKKKKKKERVQEVKAVALQPVQTVIRVLPERWEKRVGKAVENDEWKGWVAMAGGAWLLFKLAELRSMRRMNRALLATK
jgi:hypothetical protein